MQNVRVPLSVILVILALLVSTVVVCQAVATRPQPKAALVATVDLPRLLEGLNERQEAEAELEQLRGRIVTEDETRQGELRDLQTKLKETAEADVVTRGELEDQLREKSLDYNAWRQAMLQKIDIERSLRWRLLYDNVHAQLAQLCQAQGYDIVLVDDSLEELTINDQAGGSREAQVKQQFAARSIMYSNPAVDITSELIQRMNNAHIAG